MLQSMGCKELDTTERLNWTDFVDANQYFVYCVRNALKHFNLRGFFLDLSITHFRISF